MELSFTEKKNIRKNFGKLKETLTIPNLIEVQKKSYTQFLSSKDITEANFMSWLYLNLVSYYRNTYSKE